jgi:hypothetical protein
VVGGTVSTYLGEIALEKRVAESAYQVYQGALRPLIGSPASIKIHATNGYNDCELKCYEEDNPCSI